MRQKQTKNTKFCSIEGYLGEKASFNVHVIALFTLQSSRKSRHLELKERAQMLLQKAREETLSEKHKQLSTDSTDESLTGSGDQKTSESVRYYGYCKWLSENMLRGFGPRGKYEMKAKRF